MYSGWYVHRQINVISVKGHRDVEDECCRQGMSTLVQAVVERHELGSSNSKVFVCFNLIALTIRIPRLQGVELAFVRAFFPSWPIAFLPCPQLAGNNKNKNIW